MMLEDDIEFLVEEILEEILEEIVEEIVEEILEAKSPDCAEVKEIKLTPRSRVEKELRELSSEGLQRIGRNFYLDGRPPNGIIRCGSSKLGGGTEAHLVAQKVPWPTSALLEEAGIAAIKDTSHTARL